MIYQNRCTFLQLKVVFSCLGHNGKFVRSSNAREILCLVSKILCVVRYKGGWDKGRDPFNLNFRKFRSKTQWIASVQPESFEKTGPPFEVDHFSRSDRLEFWLNGSHPRSVRWQRPGTQTSSGHSDSSSPRRGKNRNKNR